MAKEFTTWKEAHNYAERLATYLGRDTGIEAMKPFGKQVFLVHHLPKPQNRYGFELRCEVVPPGPPNLKEGFIP